MALTGSYARTPGSDNCATALQPKTTFIVLVGPATPDPRSEKADALALQNAECYSIAATEPADALQSALLRARFHFGPLDIVARIIGN